MENSNQEFTYFQFRRSEEYPVYLRIQTGEYEGEVSNFLKTMGFSVVQAEDLAAVESTLNTRINARLLTVQVAGSQSSRQIEEATESDRYGLESIMPKPGYRVYRYKSFGIIVYSFNATEWQLGCYRNFGSNATALESRTVINRYLSWALAPLGVVGFWGVPVDEGMAMMKRDQSFGEVVFFDVQKRNALTMNGVVPIRSKFSLLRLDNVQKKPKRMSSEELISYLTNNSTFIDYEGPSIPIRQAIQELSRFTVGVFHPRENFTARRDISL